MGFWALVDDTGSHQEYRLECLGHKQSPTEARETGSGVSRPEDLIHLFLVLGP